jgi:cell division protein FtsA
LNSWAGHASPAAGFEDGDFTDLPAGAQAIRDCIERLESESDIFVTGFTYSISGSHLRSVRATAQLGLAGGPRAIKHEDLVEVRNRARSMAIPFDQKILTVTPVEYIVDRRRGLTSPLGRVGNMLEVNAHLITGSGSVLKNIDRAIGKAKYRSLGEEVDVLAVGRALLTQEEMDKGVMLIDVGGHATNWAVFRKGAILTNGSVPLGGESLTSDLAHGLRIAPEEAQAIKHQDGVVLRSMAEVVDLHVLFEEERPEATPGLVAAILEPRFEEIMTLVKEDFGDLGTLAELSAGIILTGGGSRCRGSGRLCEEVFDMRVTPRYRCSRLVGAEDLPDGQWGTVIGLSLWSAGDLVGDEENMDRGAGGGLLGKLRGMFRKNSTPKAARNEAGMKGRKKKDDQEELAARG